MLSPDTHVPEAMMRSILPMLMAAALVLAAGPLRADEMTTAKRDDIRKLIALTGNPNTAKQIASAISQQMFKAMKTARPDIPERAFDVVNRELVAVIGERMTASGGLMDQLIPVYARHFTHADIKEMTAFYETPVGRKALAVQAKIATESMAITHKWNATLAPVVRSRVKAALEREGLLKSEK